MTKIDEWKKKLIEQERSGMTQLAWCGINSICLSTFRYWKRKLDNTDTHKVEFVELKEETDTNAKSHPAISLEVAGIKINVFKGADIQLLKTVIQVVKTC